MKWNMHHCRGRLLFFSASSEKSVEKQKSERKQNGILCVRLHPPQVKINMIIWQTGAACECCYPGSWACLSLSSKQEAVSSWVLDWTHLCWDQVWIRLSMVTWIRSNAVASWTSRLWSVTLKTPLQTWVWERGDVSRFGWVWTLSGLQSSAWASKKSLFCSLKQKMCSEGQSSRSSAHICKNESHETWSKPAVECRFGTEGQLWVLWASVLNDCFPSVLVRLTSQICEKC